MANLLIGYPDIPFNNRGTLLSSSQAAFSLSTAANNSILGGRGEISKAAAAVASSYQQYQVDTALSSNFFYIARGSLTWSKYAGTIFTLQGSTLGTTFVNVAGGSVVTAGGIVGPNSEDFLKSFTTSTAYPYWRVLTSVSSGTVLANYSKAFFGSAFDFGREPDRSRVIERKFENQSQRKAKLTASFTWNGVSNALVQSLINNIIRYRDVMSVVIYTTSYHEVLHGYQAVHCKIKDFSTNPDAIDTNTVQMTFEELI